MNDIDHTIRKLLRPEDAKLFDTFAEQSMIEDAVTREVKRLELQIARLASELYQRRGSGGGGGTG